MTRNAIFFSAVSAVLLIGISGCHTKYILPEVSYESTVYLRNNQPDCRPEINAALDTPSQKNTLNAMFCYDRTIQYWENEYKLLELQLNALYNTYDQH